MSHEKEDQILTTIERCSHKIDTLGIREYYNHRGKTSFDRHQLAKNASVFH